MIVLLKQKLRTAVFRLSHNERLHELTLSEPVVAYAEKAMLLVGLQ